MRAIARGVVGLLVFASGAGAAGAQTPAAEERPPFQIGPVGVRPRLAVTNLGVDNNVFNESENPKSDFTFTASPDLVLSLEPGRLKLTSTAGTDLVYFKEYTSERSVNRRVSGRADLDLTVVRPFFAVAANHTSARANSEVDVRGRHHPRTYEGGATVKLTAGTSAGALVRRSREEYDEETFFRGVDLSTTLNASTTSYEGSIAAQLTPLTALSVAVSHERIRFDDQSIRDSDSLRVAPTLTFSPFGLLNGSASGGVRRLTGRDAALPDYTGFVAAGSLGMSLMDRYRIEGTFTRDVRYSYEEALPYYVLSGIRGTLTVVLAGGFDVRATGGRESMDYRAFDGAPAPGTDHLIVYGGGFGYRLSEAALVVVQAEFLDRRSSRDAAREYRNDRVFASLTWGATSR